jgi:hypothetical protein
VRSNTRHYVKREILFKMPKVKQYNPTATEKEKEAQPKFSGNEMELLIRAVEHAMESCLDLMKDLNVENSNYLNQTYYEKYSLLISKLKVLSRL